MGSRRMLAAASVLTALVAAAALSVWLRKAPKTAPPESGREIRQEFHLGGRLLCQVVMQDVLEEDCAAVPSRATFKYFRRNGQVALSAEVVNPVYAALLSARDGAGVASPLDLSLLARRSTLHLSCQDDLTGEDVGFVLPSRLQEAQEIQLYCSAGCYAVETICVKIRREKGAFRLEGLPEGERKVLVHRVRAFPSIQADQDTLRLLDIALLQNSADYTEHSTGDGRVTYLFIDREGGERKEEWRLRSGFNCFGLDALLERLAVVHSCGGKNNT